MNKPFSRTVFFFPFKVLSHLEFLKCTMFFHLDKPFRVLFPAQIAFHSKAFSCSPVMSLQGQVLTFVVTYYVLGIVFRALNQLSQGTVTATL